MELIWIPVVIVAVWILVNLARGFEAARKDPFRRPEQRPRPSSSDIERFLQEVNQRRTQQQRPQRQPAAAPRPVQPVPTARPVIRPVVEPVVVVPAEVVEPLVLDVLPADRPRLAERAPQLSRGPLKVAAPVVLTVSEETAPAHLVELHRLLRSGTGIRAAFMLHEIFSPPRCRRPFVRS